jgi:hypothetical protein
MLIRCINEKLSPMSFSGNSGTGLIAITQKAGEFRDEEILTL